MTNYPTLTRDKKNCNILKSALVTLQSDKSNILLFSQLNSPKVVEIVDKIKEYNDLYSSLSCDEYLQSQDITGYVEDSDKATQDAIDQQRKTFELINKDEKPDNTMKYVIYGVVGLIAVAFTIVLIKKI